MDSACVELPELLYNLCKFERAQVYFLYASFCSILCLFRVQCGCLLGYVSDVCVYF